MFPQKQQKNSESRSSYWAWTRSFRVQIILPGLDQELQSPDHPTGLGPGASESRSSYRAWTRSFRVQIILPGLDQELQSPDHPTGLGPGASESRSSYRLGPGASESRSSYRAWTRSFRVQIILLGLDRMGGGGQGSAAALHSQIQHDNVLQQKSDRI
ncbi:hypothetical protein CRENBAI_005098 [Crenichthys baileyi]|uniref:Uncharacterized protein n=1 Tax=Crenichthys baileyi TaxID=28760 RepID=A0AAV9S1E4_9TELE